ncbi:hypothetical protein EDB92DRAFT_2119960 [Lactarius akahatsu]|uniref:Uncharacterized protein n=1 Tax=Lactarius akahatsu TaxID=416441 RepID=A0AAD4Q742_9AGAM|nr:hypothetical protein EDB92DRAFT_2119960 [Lactarius akahatsu]
MSDFEDDFEKNFENDDDFDDTPPGLFSNLGTVRNRDDKDDDVQYMLKHPLRSRPPIDFSGQRSTVDTDGFSALAPPRSHMSGSTLRSSLHPSTVPSFPRKTSAPLARQPLPLDAIAALTDSELLHNPHYRKLRRDHDHLTSVLTTYVERELTEFRTARSEGLPPDIYQAVPRSVNSRHANSHADSRASSLGPSDSASQQARTDVMKDKAIEDLLERVEPPPLRPDFLPTTVLWDFDDCYTDKTLGDILTDNNKCRPRLSLAIRRPNGSKISTFELSNMRRSAELIVQRLIKFINSDPRSAGAGLKTRPKTFIKKYFMAEHYQAVLDLEAEQKLLRLCSAHWKADAFITKVFLERNKEKVKATTNSTPATSPQFSQSPEPPTAFNPQIREVAPMKATKRALELSPGPKSPSASHAQKRNKDNTVLSGQKTVGPGLSNQNQHPPTRKITPTFLSRTKAICAEPAPTSLHSLHVDPSADNLIAALTSEFPSLTNGPQLIYSMNAQLSFKEGEPSEQVATLLERVQSAVPCSPDIDEDNTYESWGHYQFTAGGISPASSLTSWEKVGSVATAFKLVAAAIKTCRDARSMCSNAGTPKTSGFISDVYLEKVLECLKSCWVGAGGVLTSQNRVPPTAPSYRDIAMSPPRLPPIKIKRPAPLTDVAASKTPEVPTGTNSITQPIASTERVEPSAGLDEVRLCLVVMPSPTHSLQGARASVASLKQLQVSELLACFSDNKLSAPKGKRKDDLIDVMVKSPELVHISDATIKEIIEKRKLRKGPQKPLAA